MSRGSVYVGALLLLGVASSDPVLRMCVRCDCVTKDKYVRIDCNNQQFTETHLRQMQSLQNTSFASLNFSNNNFSKVPVGFNTVGIKSLDLSRNNIVQLTDLNRYEELIELNLGYNPIGDFSNETLTLPFLKSLYMSHCSLTSLDGFENSSLSQLSTLDLSHNNLDNFNSQLFLNMTELNYLDLSYNFLIELDIAHFSQLQVLNMEGNIIGPVFVFPSTLLELNAQNNTISDLLLNEVTDEATSSLVFLYLNQNNLTYLPNISFPNLKILDLSDNELKTVPEVLNSDNCPVLEMLILSSNKFEIFKFNAPLKLMSLKANEIKTIRKLSNETFGLLENYLDGCMNVSIKDNSELHFVDDMTFAHLDLCSLDLSNNNLDHLPRLKTKSGDWRNVTLGINYQQNPVVCDCDSQWILDEFVSSYYKNKSLENFLTDLKCADPYYIRDYRLVHWFDWKHSVFCQDEETMIARMTQSAAEEPFGHILLRSSGTMLLVLTICTAFLATLFIAGLVFAKRIAVKKTRRNRRF